jgi:hypothetical protein
MPETLRAYARPDGTVPTACPACGTAGSVPPDRIKGPGEPIEVRCPCGNSFYVLAEFRKAYRRKLSLSGTYAKGLAEGDPKKACGEILIDNLSMTGVGFITAGDDSLSKGDELTIRFTLDDDGHTQIETSAVVKHVRDKAVGCAFSGLMSRQEEALASFLMLIP